MSKHKTFTAAIIVIGNEILSGRTQDTNTMWIAERLNERGVFLQEVRVIPDVKGTIIETVNDLRAKFDYIFTTGGIGPTHDDVTAESIAEAFGVALECHPEAYELLLEHYGEKNFTESRKKMAMIPAGAALIPNPVSAAPGFSIENVTVMAGVPRIMHAMLDYVLSQIIGGEPLLSNTITCGLAESELSDELGDLQRRYPDTNIGSYPHFRGGSFGLSVVLRSQNAGDLKRASEELIVIIRKHNEEPKALSVQVPIDF